MNIIVTGASRGIGYEIVRHLSNAGGNTIFAVSRNSEKLEQLKNECTPSTVVPVVCDLRNEESSAILVNEIKKRNCLINYVVNNAGAIVNKPFMAISNDDLEYVYQVNVFSVIRLIQNILPLIDPSHRGHIVNIGSMGGFQGASKFAGLSAYSSSKAALACLTECLAEEFKEKNIAFNCLALGAVQTEMLEEAFPGYKAPLTSKEMGCYISDFLVNAHKFVNGKVIPVSLSNP